MNLDEIAKLKSIVICRKIELLEKQKNWEKEEFKNDLISKLLTRQLAECDQLINTLRKMEEI